MVESILFSCFHCCRIYLYVLSSVLRYGENRVRISPSMLSMAPAPYRTAKAKLFDAGMLVPCMEEYRNGQHYVEVMITEAVFNSFKLTGQRNDTEILNKIESLLAAQNLPETSAGTDLLQREGDSTEGPSAQNVGKEQSDTIMVQNIPSQRKNRASSKKKISPEAAFNGEQVPIILPEVAGEMVGEAPAMESVTADASTEQGGQEIIDRTSPLTISDHLHALDTLLYPEGAPALDENPAPVEPAASAPGKKGKTAPVVYKAIEQFKALYLTKFKTPYATDATDYRHMKLILEKIKKKADKQKIEDSNLLANWSWFVKKLLDFKEDSFILTNFRVQLINSHFNSLYKQIKDGQAKSPEKKNGNKVRHTTKEELSNSFGKIDEFYGKK